MNWRSIQGEPCPRPMSTGIGSSPLQPCQEKAVTDNGWLDKLLIQLRFVFHLSPENISTDSAIKTPVCAPPEKPVNGYLLPVYGPKQELISVNYRCHPLFTLIGSQQRICLPNGTWSGTVPTCAKGKFSPRGFWSLFLVIVKYRSRILHLLGEFVSFLF